MKMPLSPNKPHLYTSVPKEQYEIFNKILPPESYETFKILDYLKDVAKKENIKIEDIFISNPNNSCYDCDPDEMFSIFYKTYKKNKNYASELKKYNKELTKFNNEMESYNIAEVKYEEEFNKWEIYNAKKVLAEAEKKKAAAEKEITEAKKKIKLK